MLGICLFENTCKCSSNDYVFVQSQRVRVNGNDSNVCERKIKSKHRGQKCESEWETVLQHCVCVCVCESACVLWCSEGGMGINQKEEGWL